MKLPKSLISQVVSSSQPSRISPIKTALLAVSILGMASCGALSASSSSRRDVQTGLNGVPNAWLNDGSIAISRPAPGVAEPSEKSMLGFIPTLNASHTGAWLAVDTKKQTLTLMDGESVVQESLGDGVETLKPGTYQIIHMQRNALWYASDEYFSKRNLVVPSQGDKSRYRRGALGDFVIFLDKETPIHSGPIWADDIGGVRVEENDLSKIFYLLKSGAAVEVK